MCAAHLRCSLKFLIHSKPARRPACSVDRGMDCGGQEPAATYYNRGKAHDISKKTPSFTVIAKKRDAALLKISQVPRGDFFQGVFSGFTPIVAAAALGICRVARGWQFLAGVGP
jgi:hypothetical protein